MKSLKRVNRRDVFGQINCGYNNEIVPIPLCLYPDLFEAKSDRNQLYWDQCEEYAPFTYHFQGNTLFLYIDNEAEVQFCIGTRPDGTLSVDHCQSADMYQQWTTLSISQNTLIIRSLSLDKCIESNSLGRPVTLATCNGTDPSQNLNFRRHIPSSRERK